MRRNCLKLRLLAAATLGLGIFAQAGAVTSTTLNVTVASSVATVDDYLLFYSGGVAAFYSLGALPATTLLPGGVLSRSYTVPGDFSSVTTAIGLASASDVVVALGSGISNATITSGWSSIFLASESAIAMDLATANTTALTAFFTSELANNSADFIAYSGSTGTGNVAEFSSSVIGSLNVSSGSAVPEPSTGVLLGFGIGAVILTGTRKRWIARIS